MLLSYWTDSPINKVYESMPSLNPELRPKAEMQKIISELCHLLRKGDTKRYVLVCDNPQNFELAAIAEWAKGIDSQKSRLAETSGGTEPMLIESDIVIMESVTFAAAPPVNLEADVVFANAGELEYDPPKCDILMITAPVNQNLIEKISRNIHRDGRIIIYV